MRLFGPEATTFMLGFFGKLMTTRKPPVAASRNATEPFRLAAESGERRGAMGEVTWPAGAIQLAAGVAQAPLGENRLIQT